MKNILPLCGFICALILPSAAHADTLYTVSNGVLTNYLGTTVIGSYSGTFYLNSYFTLDSGSFNAIVNGTNYTGLNAIVDNNPTSGYAAFFDSVGDHLNFQLTGTQTSPVLCTVALCGSDDTLFDPASGGNFSANGGSVTWNLAAAPEPSSIVLLATGALGIVEALRRRRHP